MKFLKLTILALILLLLTTQNSLAEEQVELKVSGLVCPFCIQGVKKSFEKTKATKTVDVDLDNHQVTLTFLDNKTLTDEEIGEVLKSSGYNLLEVKRNVTK